MQFEVVPINHPVDALQFIEILTTLMITSISHAGGRNFHQILGKIHRIMSSLNIRPLLNCGQAGKEKISALEHLIPSTKWSRSALKSISVLLY